MFKHYSNCCRVKTKIIPLDPYSHLYKVLYYDVTTFLDKQISQEL